MIKQVPTQQENWLHDSAEDYNRIFSKEIYRPEDSEPWNECTDDEKVAFEKEHLMPLPPEE